MMGFNTFGWGFGGGFMMLFVWLIGIFLVVLVVKLLVTNGKCQSHTHAEEILKERYAKGEMTKKEFDEKIRGIRGE
ncbi:MAG: hypothetical protein A3B74_04555 [Candidatus Kerfeldbacteria bacterium RIFCSPHIGHO2_02_FULL_42_14]|uniref:SHOCT domain-containing protein n=1 Tax=Candidatus Kerfeldbacteria bacterium RIFCSPHIGHO2_02_FULL_42_14 TaxID=1798540 RepID=A0A1G2AQC4_9BACT|nr:MAG: hypothetical protein A3B74_04555 [Candidatus Kerfeldbacteria bacterium RIFCSPHIGHO2_02_FULL_42_14]OGY82147.1 MAG: hypothetical protein A3E60_00265 [Candidatus Kerfeldbacteria bacterium RIFCSPHIGHO2_12_FULL_42_13]OGY85021.1 MAG: hypothetical protein A3I91_00600 [Candidatus Kerfeldbacteria bacterium RIFCSPLOWO2_02_FULL_42_19]OGY86167.1 MAG: hypothetical protein A3G01_02135 [Candidatus Kerfeldbacteria bacterium RIFCSPLOWO2_12_FULL_43_9]